MTHSLGLSVLVEAREVNLLHVAHVENVLQEGEVTEDVLVRHLDREGSLGADAIN